MKIRFTDGTSMKLESHVFHENYIEGKNIKNDTVLVPYSAIKVVELEK